MLMEVCEEVELQICSLEVQRPLGTAVVENLFSSWGIHGSSACVENVDPAIA